MGRGGRSSGQTPRAQRKATGDRDTTGSGSTARDIARQNDIARQEEEVNYLAGRLASAERDFLDAREEYIFRMDELSEARDELNMHDSTYYDINVTEEAYRRAERDYDFALESYRDFVDRYNRAVDDYNGLVGRKDKKRYVISDYA